MEKTVTPIGTPPDMEKVLNFIFENAFGTPIELESVPVLEELSVNTWGYYGNDFYIKLSDSKGIKITGASFT